MPIVSLQDAQRNIALFKQNYIDLANNPELTPKKRKESRNSCNKKILRWQTYVKTMIDNGDEISDDSECSFKYRYSGVHISSEQAQVCGMLGGRPRMYTSEELKERVREQKRNYSRKYYAARKKQLKCIM
jgi:hypothetical protein